MTLSKLYRWLPKSLRGTPARTPAAPPRRPALGLEGLEAREVPATFTWIGGNGTLWSTGANWAGGVAPKAADTALVFPAGAFSIDDVAGLNVDRVTFNGGNTVLLQQQLGLDGSAPGDQVVLTGGAASSIAGVGGLNLTGTASQVDVGGNASLTFSTDLTGPGVLRKVGTGTLELTGAASYQGATQAYAGILALNNAGVNLAVSGGALQIGDGVGAAGSAEVRLLDTSEIPNTAPITIAADGVLNLNGKSEIIGDLTLGGGSVNTANGILTLAGTVTVTATSSIDIGATSGAVNLGTADRTISVAAGANLTVTAQITGGVGIVKTGVGTLTFDTGAVSVSNTYSGVTKVNDGGLILDNNKVDGALAGGLNVGDGTGAAGSAFVQLLQSQELPNAATIAVFADGLLDFNGKNDVVGAIGLTGGQVTTGAGTLTLAGNVTVSASPVAASITGNVSVGTADRTFTVADGTAASDLVFTGVISGANGIIKDGPGTLEIKGAAAQVNTYTGTTLVKDGVLALNNNGANTAVSKAVVVGDGAGAAGSAVLRLLQSSEIPDDATVTARADGRFDLAAFNDTIGSLVIGEAAGGGLVSHTGIGSGLNVVGDVTANAAPTAWVITGALNLPAGNHAFTIADGAAALDLQIDAKVGGAGAIVKGGIGTLALTGNNSYTGDTMVSAGTLIVNGSSPNSAITLTAGVLAGNGSVGTVTASGGAVSPGVGGPGTLTTNRRSSR